LICALFHDLVDGPHFGKIVATSILRSFAETFVDVSFSSTINVSMFSGFAGKMFDAISSSNRGVLLQSIFHFIFVLFLLPLYLFE
jgi:hypothetical protein